ncbi:GH92 family glycosyl hydrolase [Fluviicola chungangensis]|uniref:Glycoside hydrolase family 92 protein n=1 Tax=Fluviicola chungangensis TaxID=2597671 RepID=A0A556N6Y0_9FLAO|nr:GH92 family glycosyl hydrolase [Fluviicola chungangensis]TSJ47936.1 glycoside hydrolase family 92 protein [Fluviicola chungangensis]
MKRLLFLLIPFAATAQFKPIEYVNPLMGTDSKMELSNGNTYPAIGLPWGMNLWTPQTNVMGDGWAYQYNADQLRGFKQTHQPSPWMNDYGQFAIMPGSGKVVFDQNERASWFSHKSEVSKPNYYSVYLADCDVTTEITPTERAAVFRFTFPKNDSSFIVIDALDRGSYVKVFPKERKIIGYTKRYSRGKLTNFKNYFVIYLDRDIAFYSVASDGKLIGKQEESASNHSGVVVGFKTKKGEQVQLKVASSFISQEQAEWNLQREVGAKDFNRIRTAAEEQWNKTLGKIEVSGGTEEQMRTFYSCLYRTLFFPNKLYEIDSSGKEVHWSPYNGKVLPGKMFGGTGFWDTFRALYPLLNLVYPEINKEMQEGLVNDYLEGGFLPEWSSPGFADIMIGNNSASIVSDAYIKGLRGYDIEKLYEALLHGANNEGPVNAVGREGVEYYNRLGYVPYDVKINENAARTLEYAYDDFAIYQLAKALERPQEEIDLYAKRCQNYRNLFDPSTGMMRGKNTDGAFQSPFNPFKWGDAFTEGNSWHYTWSVFHDVQGLIDLMGGKERFVTKLDSVFSLPPVYDDSYYGGMIHEIKEMQIANMGQYAHGNQPIQHMIYLYNYAGDCKKTQYWVREVLNRLYKPTPDGYCGDEDNGQTSAWYVFSALGFYPVCPATDEYILGAPLFKKAIIHLSQGKQVVLNAPQNSVQNKYISSVKMNSKDYSKLFLKHSELLRGAVLDFDMSPTPALDRKLDDGDFPYSFSREKRPAK